ncbi:hypothetical protein [Streptomyces wuyuanensis]|uniref:hypothetical protein n=1 Tax=Streptomyces wuyuanensis TaxID=1196353 RepID=UPI0037BB9C38
MPSSPAWDLLVDHERPNFIKSGADTDSCLAAPGIGVTREGREEMSARFGDQELLGIDESGAFWADDFAHIGERYALERIGEVDELVSAHDGRTEDDMGWPYPREPAPAGPRWAKRRVPECWEWRVR